MDRLTDSVAVVTGAASGIGAAIARRFAEEGADVWFLDIDENAALEVARSCGERARAAALDVRDAGAFSDVIGRVVKQHGRIDILCNNAGVSGYGNLVEMPLETWREVMSVDLEGVYHGCRAALPHMAAAGGGVILNIASVAGMRGFSGMAAYSAAKAGVINLTRSVALDHAHEGIRANAICPGLIATPMTAAMRLTPEMARASRASVPMRREAQPAEVAAAALFLVSKEASYITGAVLPVDGGTSCAMRQRRSAD